MRSRQPQAQNGVACVTRMVHRDAESARDGRRPMIPTSFDLGGVAGDPGPMSSIKGQPGYTGHPDSILPCLSPRHQLGEGFAPGLSAWLSPGHMPVAGVCSLYLEHLERVLLDLHDHPEVAVA